MSYKAKRIAKSVAKTSVWAISDIVFLVLKIIGGALLTAVTTGVIFMCIFLIYVKTNLYTELDINPADFAMNLSSEIYYIDPETGAMRELVTLQSVEFRVYVDVADIPQHTIEALVAIEDHRFFKHSGVDWYRTSGAFLNMFLSMRDTFGGSTITQQLIKNLTSEDETTVQRKMLEIFRALEYEKQYTKDDILELYFNLVYFGHGRYGIAAAADYYFGKDIANLSLAESAAIVGITNNPSKYSPYTNRTANKERQELILERMCVLEYITEAECARAKREVLNFKRGEHSEYEDVIYTWFEEAVINDVIADLVKEKGFSESAARRRLFTGGFKIISTLNPSMQAIVDSVYENPESLPKVTGSSAQLQSGIIIADPYTGEVRALSGGVGSKTKNMLLNRATMTRRPPGSAIKPIAVYAPAMEYGKITVDTPFDDSENVPGVGPKNYMPKNADRSYRGIVDVRTAVRVSLNTVATQVLDLISPTVSFRFMKDILGFGLHPSDEDYAPLSVGQLTYGATVREMTSGFTIFPNAGQRVELRTYTVVYDSNNAVLIDNTPKYHRATSEAVAYWMTTMLTDVVTSGTGGSANLYPMPTAGKTGTTTDSKDRWFVGFTPYYISAVWTGYDMPAVMSSSGNPAAQIWKTIMSQVHEGLEVRSFNVPGDVYLPPVQGVQMTDYAIRCVDTEGIVILEEIVRGFIGRRVIVIAPDIEGYVLLDEAEKELAIVGDYMWDVVEFIYELEAPEEEEDPEDEPTEEPTDDPYGEPTDDPEGSDSSPAERPTDEPSGDPYDPNRPPVESPSSEPPPAQLPPVNTEQPDPTPQAPPQESPTHQLPPAEP